MTWVLKNVYNPTFLVHKNNLLAKKKDKDITFEDLSKQKLIMVDKRKVLPYFAKVCEEFNIGGNIEFENGDWEVIRNFIKLNMGICLFCDLYDQIPIFKDKDIISKKINHLYPMINYSVITKKGLIFAEPVRYFLKLMDENYFVTK